MSYELIHGDCLEKMKDIEQGSIDLVLTDPPYGTTACKWDSVIPFQPMWECINKVIKSNAAICLFGSEPFSSLLRVSNLKNFKYDWIWFKNKPSGAMIAKKQPLRSIESISVFYNEQANYYPVMVKRTEKELMRFAYKSKITNGSSIDGRKYGKTPNRFDALYKYPINLLLNFKTVFTRGSDYYGHQTQKPVALLEYLIKTYTKPGETVLDFTMGSGSTGVACINTGRNFIGIEKEKKYFDIATKRLKEGQMKKCLSNEKPY
jgi:site-specific DNA-methyltransferase (adenine-specific)